MHAERRSHAGHESCRCPARSKLLFLCLVVAAQFGGQEPGSNAEVKKFAQARGAKYPIMAKIDVNGSNGESACPPAMAGILQQAFASLILACWLEAEDPLYSFLKAKQGGLLNKGKTTPPLSPVPFEFDSSRNVHNIHEEGLRMCVVHPDIKWNFTKFLVNREGEVVQRVGTAVYVVLRACGVLFHRSWQLPGCERCMDLAEIKLQMRRYGSSTTPLQIEDDIKALL